MTMEASLELLGLFESLVQTCTALRATAAAALVETTDALRFVADCAAAMELDDIDEMVLRRDELASRLAASP
ncbi:hypothetical protein [Arenibaculum pallidiluteum]|uniref:hypothetical protein n=1 Tax=Arenibaculum pallidiluteum TaxID=2812559 RepID=UPI001A971327|nr:hypothetical protein [Arenibaculum pallidiluteum]